MSVEKNNLNTSAELLEQVINIAAGAAEKIMVVYEAMGEMEVNNKADDSPLTKADLAAHQHICGELEKISSLPILSEESVDISAAERLSWKSYWLVDPLDGTKEFIAKNGEFTVNIALVHEHDVVLGVVYVPATRVCYFARKGQGAFKQAQGERKKMHSRKLADSIKAGKLALVGSRRHGSDALEALVQDLKNTLCDVELVNQGSSLKFCVLAEGKADLYPRLALTSEWDTAAAQIVLEEAGGAVWNPDLTKMRYNTKQEILNPFFWAVAEDTAQWRNILAGRIQPEK